jgi:hypothetical protein
MLIPAAEYRPDVADLNTAFTDDLLNVLVADGSYIPAPAFADLTEALGAAPLGAISVKQTDGSVSFFAGTADKLWKLNNTDLTWDDVSQALTTYSATTAAPWSFGVFGNFVIAVNQNDDPQVLEIGVDTVFRDLGGSPPRAGIVRIWGDFVALMRLTGNPNRVQWSGLNDCEFWTPGTNNSDYQDFPDGGTVQGSSEATNPIIFLESAIQRATFVPGSLEIFTFQKIHDRRGAKSPYSIATRGAFAFYADEGGFFQISPDGSITPIGFEKVDRTVFKRLSASSISKIYGAVDPFFSRVYWAIDYAGTGVYDHMIVYDWNIGKWTQIEVSVLFILPMVTSGYTLESLDAVSASIDDLPFSLDSKAWQGGAPFLAAFSTDNTLGAFSGDNLEATVTTQEVGDTNGQVMRTTETYPVVDTDNVFVSIGHRMRRSAGTPVVWMSEQSPSYNTGIIRKRSRARFHRFKMRVPAGETWNHIKGIDVKSSPAGMR